MGYAYDPEAIGRVVKTVAKDFKGDILVTENGVATANDTERVEFITRSLASLEDCLVADIPLRGYFYWSLLDNFEWQLGFARTFGLIAVDRKTQKRHAKESLYVLGRYAQNKGALYHRQ
jgi:beta-glucosidase